MFTNDKEINPERNTRKRGGGGTGERKGAARERGQEFRRESFGECAHARERESECVCTWFALAETRKAKRVSYVRTLQAWGTAPVETG